MDQRPRNTPEQSVSPRVPPFATGVAAPDAGTTAGAGSTEAEDANTPDAALLVPPVPETLADTGLSVSFVSDLIVKTLYSQGARKGEVLEEAVRLPFALLDDELLTLQQRRLVEVRGAQGHGRRGYTFDLTGEGRNRAREILQTSRYVGPAPVPLDQYWDVVSRQSSKGFQVDRDQIHDAFQGLVFEEDFIDTLGPALNSGKSLFLYGHAGNGKTSIAEAVAAMLGGAIYIPYALEVDGQIISLYDPVSHREVEHEPTGSPNQPYYLRTPPPHDLRFIRVRRPVVMVGGELTLNELELQFDAQSGAFRAPPQLKANGGVFVIDDFGRQRVRPRDLLNRWMIPLDRHMDYLNLPMGHKLPVPFDCLLIFATNLDPTELVEEAFLRRIQYKILVDSPTRGQYERIFESCCANAGIGFRPEAVEYIYDEYYDGRGLAPRACHPRDIVNHLLDIARYAGQDPSSDEDTLERACQTYFLDMPVNRGEGERGQMTGETAGGRWSSWKRRESGKYDG